MDKEKILQENKGLVYLVINEKFRSFEWCKDDLYQVGMIGLWMSIDRFDPSKGYKFSTYATKYISGYIKGFLRREIPARDKFVSMDSLYQDGEEYTVDFQDETIDIENEIQNNEMVKYYFDIIKSLPGTEIQKAVYEDYILCRINGVGFNLTDFSKRHGVSRQRCTHIIKIMTKRAQLMINRSKRGDEIYELEQPGRRFGF
jgi:RNA polymerase sigma factor (sigma-70 family)